MSLHYDEKGKFFTDYVTKEAVRTLIQTHTHRIIGNVYVRVGERVSDQLNKAGPFLPVTDVEVQDPIGAPLFRTDFLAVNLDQVIWMMPTPTEEDAPDEAEAEE